MAEVVRSVILLQTGVTWLCLCSCSPLSQDGWKEYFTADGVPYYFNATTQETSWDKPDCMKTEEELEGSVCGCR